MKRYLTFILLLSGMIGATLFAQTIVPNTPPAVREGDFAFIKKYKATGNGLAMDISGDPETVTNMLTKRLEEASGAKIKSFKKGISGMEGVIIEAISGNTFDYYFRVDELKNESNPRSKITFFASVGNYNFLNTEKYPSEIEACKIWLQKLSAWQRLKEIAVEESAQQAKLAEAVKKQESREEEEAKLMQEKTKLAEEMAKLEEKMKALKEKIDSNQESIAKQEKTKNEYLKEIEKMRATLQKLLNEKISLQQ